MKNMYQNVMKMMIQTVNEIKGIQCKMKLNKPFAMEFYNKLVQHFTRFKADVTIYSNWYQWEWIVNPEDMGFEGIRVIKLLQNLPRVNKYGDIFTLC